MTRDDRLGAPEAFNMSTGLMRRGGASSSPLPLIVESIHEDSVLPSHNLPCVDWYRGAHGSLERFALSMLAVTIIVCPEVSRLYPRLALERTPHGCEVV